MGPSVQGRLTEEFRILAAAKRHLTYANVMATVALFVALGGSSYAALRIGRNSIRAREIAPNAVHRSELANRSVGTGEIVNGTLLAEDFRISPRGVKGPKGDRGPTGPAGPRGVVGPQGTVNAVIRVGSMLNTAPGESGTVQADCQSGERAVGGGAAPLDPSFASDASIMSSVPSPTIAGSAPTSWLVGVKNTAVSGGPNVTFESYAVCVPS
jgi:hypothetical protein